MKWLLKNNLSLILHLYVNTRSAINLGTTILMENLSRAFIYSVGINVNNNCNAI